LDWIERRARQATAAEKVRWLEMLVQAGEPARAARVAESGADGSFLGESYWRAVQATRDLPKLRKVLSAAIAAARAGKPLRVLAQLALEENERELSARAFGRLLEIEPTDREALEQMGRHLYASGRRTEALAYFGRLRNAGGASWEADWLSAEVLGRQGNVRQAAALLRNALERIDQATQPDAGMRNARPQILFRLGRIAESRQAWEALMRERPGDVNLRADYVAMLIEQRSYDRAREVLDAH
jgi:Tfp pilus assembly protein PilF